MRKGMVYYGFFREFLGQQSLVFAGDRESLGKFEALIRESSADVARRCLPLNDVVLFIHPAAEVEVDFEAPCESCINQIDGLSAGSMKIVWGLSRSRALSVAQAIASLVDSDTPGHQYLEVTGDVQIVASCEEYSDEFMFASGDG